MSDELSDNRKEYWTKQAEYANVDILTVEISKLDLGWAIGNSPRGIIGIMDQGMAEAIRKKIAE
jgi:ribosomal protein L30E